MGAIIAAPILIRTFLQFCSLRNIGIIQNALHNIAAGYVFGFGLVGGYYAVAQRIGRNLLDIFGGNKAAPFDKGMGFGRAYQADAGPGRRAKGDERSQI